MMSEVFDDRDDDRQGFTLWQFAKVMLLALAFMIACVIILPPVSATSWGEPNHSANVLENNAYVMQGDSIAQGNYYDLTGVYGWSGVLGHWKNEYDVGIVAPTDVVNLNNLRPRKVYMDPAVWKIGGWYQLDEYDGSSSTSYEFSKANNYVFYVVGAGNYAQRTPAPAAPVTVATQSGDYTSTVYVWDGTTSTRVNVTMIATAKPTALPSDVITVIIPVTTTPKPVTIPPTPETVTPRTPLPTYLSALAILGVLLWYRH